MLKSFSFSTYRRGNNLLKSMSIFGFAGYDYYSSIGSCYKVPNVAYTWQRAYEECQKEGAHLVVINSELERRVVWDVIKVAEKPIAVHNFLFFLAGFRAERTFDGLSREFKTIFSE